ncbi:MAG: ethanolamine ammonia-lyase subunit EutB [Planctomycetaceae bacterium]|nr:ethanolamine ammonia-lyase subunit EutB [Planctomycetaceae bacterium]
MIRRREFLKATAGFASGTLFCVPQSRSAEPIETETHLPPMQLGEDVFTYLKRTRKRIDLDLYKRVLGAANEFKEGDQIVGIAAGNEHERLQSRKLLAATRLGEIDRHTVYRDQLSNLITKNRDAQASQKSHEMTLGELKTFLLERDEPDIKRLAEGLSSDGIACLVKLMTNAELIAVSRKVFHPLPGSQIGAKGYLGARIQPNSPTDDVNDIRWQVLDGWSYAVGDVVLGTNPVSSDPQSVAAVETTLKDLLVTFGIEDVLPHCVLSHIDVQAKVEADYPGSTALWFQSIAGCDSANTTFDIDIDKMLKYANARRGRYGLYFETGQGADFTNGHSHGFDMVIHESRKYGFARSLKNVLEKNHQDGKSKFAPWVHLNDVAGFIGPEVFRTREQLVRCCLEDLVMGKLHGLCIGLDVCSTLHMDISLEDLDWCLEQLMPANPAYLMALPTKIDPMLGYLTTGYQDHVRLREKFGYKVNDRIWQFFQELGVVDSQGRPTDHFGDPNWVYLQYCRRKGDTRTDRDILQEGRNQIDEVRGRGVFLAEGHGRQAWDLNPTLQQQIQKIYSDSKKCIWTEWDPAFVSKIPNRLTLKTNSADRTDYILHPETGEQLSAESLRQLTQLRNRHDERYDVQIVISDGLNALALMDAGHLAPFLKELREKLKGNGYKVAKENLIISSGRVRAGYRIGEALFGKTSGRRAILHVIGERPGSGHHTFSVYMTSTTGPTWGQPGKVDHNVTKVVSGIAVTALAPVVGAGETVRILKTMA